MTTSKRKADQLAAAYRLITDARQAKIQQEKTTETKLQNKQITPPLQEGKP